jgi:hypothetical protein
MADVIADLIEMFVTGGIPSPDSVENQRRARLAVSIVALFGNSGLYLLLGASALRGWAVLALLGMTFAACWVLVFSVVDIAKELPSVVWLSITAGVVAAAGIAVAALSALATAV